LQRARARQSHRSQATPPDTRARTQRRSGRLPLNSGQRRPPIPLEPARVGSRYMRFDVDARGESWYHTRAEEARASGLTGCPLGDPVARQEPSVGSNSVGCSGVATLFSSGEPIEPHLFHPRQNHPNASGARECGLGGIGGPSPSRFKE
jgi:hypothetical protein